MILTSDITKPSTLDPQPLTLKPCTLEPKLQRGNLELWRVLRSNRTAIVRCRVNSARIRQSRPDSGLVFQVKFLKTFLVEVVGDRTTPSGREVRRTNALCVPTRAPQPIVLRHI